MTGGLHNPIQIIANGRPDHAGADYYQIPGVSLYAQVNTVIVANRIYYEGIIVHTTITIDALAIFVRTGAAGGSKARLAIYRADKDWQPTTLVGQSGEIAVDGAAVVEGAIAVTLAPGRYLLAIVSDNTPTLNYWRGAEPFHAIVQSRTDTAIVYLLTVNKVYAAFVDPGTLWDTGSATSNAMNHMILVSITTP